MVGGSREWHVVVVEKTAEEWRQRPALSQPGGGRYPMDGPGGRDKVRVVRKGGEGVAAGGERTADGKVDDGWGR